MRIDEDGKMHTLDQDVQELWIAHGWKIVEVKLPAHPHSDEATWIIKAHPMKEAA